MIGLGFAIRANIAGDIQTSLFGVIDLARSGTMIGQALGATFLTMRRSSVADTAMAPIRKLLIIALICVTEGCGRLPTPADFESRLAEAGFSDIESRSLIPGQRFHAFLGSRPWARRRRATARGAVRRREPSVPDAEQMPLVQT